MQVKTRQLGVRAMSSPVYSSFLLKIRFTCARCVRMCMSGQPRRPEASDVYGAGVMGGCVLLDMVLGTELLLFSPLIHLSKLCL